MLKSLFGKILTVFVALALVVLLICGCGKKADATDKNKTQGESTFGNEKVTYADMDYDDLVLTDIENIDDYVILRSDRVTKTVEDACTALQKAIAEKTGVTLKIKTDTTEETANEIIVGKTKREVSGIGYDTLNAAQSAIVMDGKFILIAGGSDVATADAVKLFTEKCIVGDSIKVPAKGYPFISENKNVLSSVTLCGTPLDEFIIISKLNDKTIAETFAQSLETVTYKKLTVYNFYGKEKSPEKHKIILDDTNSDYSYYSVSAKDGDIVLYANYTTMDACIKTFMSEMLGIDSENGKLLGSTTVVVDEGTEIKKDVAKFSIYSKEKLMEVLREVYEDDSHIIVGQQMGQRLANTVTEEKELYKTNCGVDGALYAFDLGEMVANSKYTASVQNHLAYDFIKYMSEGGIISFSMHLENPTGNWGNAAHYRGELGLENEWDELLTDGTEINKNFKNSITKIADFLEKFKENNAPIILRPLHEMNGNWFWFCIVGNDGKTEKILPSSYAVRLWTYIHDYFVNERGIDNMIWEYSPNVAAGGQTPSLTDVMYCYPGDDMCDIVGLDWYTSKYKNHDALTSGNDSYGQLAATGKVVSICEFGPSDAIRTDYKKSDKDSFTCDDLDDILQGIMNDKIHLSYILLWSSWSEVRISMWNMGNGNFFYENPCYMTIQDTYNLLYN